MHKKGTSTPNSVPGVWRFKLASSASSSVGLLPSCISQGSLKYFSIIYKHPTNMGFSSYAWRQFQGWCAQGKHGRHTWILCRMTSSRYKSLYSPPESTEGKYILISNLISPTSVYNTALGLSIHSTIKPTYFWLKKGKTDRGAKLAK